MMPEARRPWSTRLAQKAGEAIKRMGRSHGGQGGQDMLDKLAPQVPLGRVGLPEEVAEAVLWLSSPSSSYVHGALLDISGGR